MRTESLFEKIGNLRDLTASEAKIVHFIRRAFPRVVFETATSIGQKAGVSKATVVRFISRLGYPSFARFQESLQLEMQEQLDKPIERFKLRRTQIGGGEIDHLAQNITQIMENLRGAHDRIKPEHFKKAAHLLARNEGAVYVVGSLNSFGLAYFFWYYANYLRGRVHLLDNLGSALPHQLSNLAATDILFVITHRRYSRQTELIVQYFAQHGNRIIMLSDIEANPFSHLAHLVLIAPTESVSMFESSSASLAVLESLLAAMAHLLETKIYDRSKVADGLSEHFGVFTSSPLSAQIRRLKPQSGEDIETERKKRGR
jgi:DNA-binding MurR/RpiR family transcriptional regulator